MESARKLNGLVGADVQPWHLKASYEVFGDDGKSQYKGTYEEWWVSEKQYRRNYQSPPFSQTEYGTEKGGFRTQNPDWPQGPVALIRKALVDPLPSNDEIENATPKIAEKTLGGAKFWCVSLQPRHPRPDASFPSYCLEPERAVVRLTTGFDAADASVLNRMVPYNGRWIGGDIALTRLRKLSATIHLDTIEPIGQVRAADFQPPADAVPRPPRRIWMRSDLAAANLVERPRVEYPGYARAALIQGTVVLTATIGSDGKVTSVRFISGPPALRSTAKEAVEKSIYKPFSMDGEPVEVETQINVVFGLPGPSIWPGPPAQEHSLAIP